MAGNFGLSDELYGLVDKQKKNVAVNETSRQENKSNPFNKQQERRENVSSSQPQHIYHRKGGNQMRRVASSERIPQKMVYNKRMETNFVQPRRNFNNYANRNTRGHSMDRSFNSASQSRDQNSNTQSHENGASRSRERHEIERMSGFGYNRLKALLKKNSDELIMELTCKKDDFCSLLEEKLRPDMIMLVAEILAKISGSSMKENKAALLVHSVRPNVLEMFSSHSCDIVVKDFSYTKEMIANYFENLAVFYEDIVEIIPNTATDHLKEHLIKTAMAIQSLSNFKKVTIAVELEQKFNHLISAVISMVEARKSGACKKEKSKVKLEWQPSGTDFREMSVFPLPEDVLLRTKIRLSPVVINGPYKSVEHYLDVQFQLMREDFLIPLRDGIMNFIEQNNSKVGRLKRIENVRFYKGVRFLSQFVEGDALITEVLFDPRGSLKKINWIRSKRFKYGSLVCFSSDLFRSLHIGVIVNRDVELLSKGILQCELIGDVKEDLFGKEFNMAESEVYFEAYQHVLKALKIFNETNFPMKEYIINVSSDVVLPNYLALNPDAWYYFENYDFQVLDPFSWPSMDKLKVNQSQLKALHSALTQKLVVIQGPPGTGKTYLGLIIAKLLLKNSNLWKNQSTGPILVVCFTNHALDQFLEGILSFTRKIVRVGSQSKNEKMGEFNLKVKRWNRGAMNSALKSVEVDLETHSIAMNRSNNSLKALLQKAGIVSLCHLKNCMNRMHSSWFIVKGEYKDSLLVEWLLEEAYFKNYSNAGDGLGVAESLPENSNLVYACTLMEIQTYIFQLENDRVSTRGYDPQELNNIIELYMSRFFYLKKKLTDSVSQDNSLIIKLERVQRLEEVSHEHRWVLYNYWISKIIQEYHVDLTEKRERYHMLNQQKCEILDTLSLRAMLESDVVGITTTGAARQQTLLQKLGARIVIVEEAAEVMESHVIVSLSKKCEHLILIGDHKQLRPSPAVYKLAKDYNFDISLFERMLRNNVPYDTLNIQHRMRPDIADLIIPAIYPSLENHESVLKYENIFGLKKNLFFITHTNPEDLAIDDTSKKNTEEARFLIALCRHIVLQGYEPSQITILATYIGQMFCLKEERDNFNIVKDVQITCVDNYQGEENDIILLSLVRNNSEGKIGFLGTDNRVCVALSRAKKGLYIMGNIEILSAKSPLWAKVREVLAKKEAVGTHLTLQCLNHPSQLTKVSKADDFISIREGGCTLMCETKLHCGHICKKMCHMMGHNDYKCNETCGKRMCIQDHRCKKLCWENCGECMVPLQRELPCGHIAILPCHVEPSEHKCQELVNVELPDCKHTITKRCYLDVKDARCSFSCDSRLPCGHVCEWKCHVKNDPEHLEYKCIRPCGRKNLECKDEHMCQRKCNEECSRCTFKVKRQLPNCEHFYDMECWVDPGTIECRKPCKKMLSCGHKCPLKCFKECGGCQVIVEKEIPDCKHKMKMKCCEIPQRSMCTMKCERVRTCGHKCQNICGLLCTDKPCHAFLTKTVLSPCGHQVRVFCHELHDAAIVSSLAKRCLEPCAKILECSHQCKGTCGGCMQGRIHIPCQEKCGKNLICGHECTVSCSKSCPPCKKPCFIKCDHSACRKNCGASCSSCKEKCNWECEHFQCKKQCGEMCDRPPCNEPCRKVIPKCGHPCIGFCGEKCPPLCRICDADELEEIMTFLGSDEEVARFVLLPDCKHVINAYGLEKWLAMDKDVIKMKVCPMCSTPIQNAYRFGNIIKQHLINVMKVKRKVFGDVNNVKHNLNKAYKNLADVSMRKEFTKSKEHLNQLLALVKRCKQRHFDAFLLNSLEARTQFVLQIAENLKEMGKKLDQLKICDYVKTANVLIKIILRRLDILSTQEHSDISGECMRFHLMLQLAAVENTDGFKTYSKTSWYKTYEECKNLISSLQPFPRVLYGKTHDKINEVYKVVTFGCVGLSKVEMNEVVKAINLHQGHWNMCPNGHVYVIADCGGATVEARCNECGARIGGTDHQLLTTNRRLDFVPQGL